MVPITSVSSQSISVLGTGTDVDGTIEAYSWIQKDGPVNVVLKNRLNPTVEATGFTQPGIYTFSFKVADNLGAQSSGKMFINVKL